MRRFLVKLVKGSVSNARAIAPYAFLGWMCYCVWGWSQNGRYVTTVRQPYIVQDTRTGYLYVHRKGENGVGIATQEIKTIEEWEENR